MLITLCNYSPVIIVCSKLSRFSDRNKLLMLLLRCVCAKCFFSFFLSLSLALFFSPAFFLFIKRVTYSASGFIFKLPFFSTFLSFVLLAVRVQLFKVTSYVLPFLIRSSRSRARRGEDPDSCIDFFPTAIEDRPFDGPLTSRLFNKFLQLQRNARYLELGWIDLLSSFSNDFRWRKKFVERIIQAGTNVK